VPKYLDLPKPTVTHSITKAQDGYNITLSTDVLAKNVYLTAGGGDYFFSDNYFDILPGQEVTVHLKTDLSEDELSKVLSLRTLRDTYGDEPVPGESVGTNSAGANK
jgi:beta-mannosidase